MICLLSELRSSECLTVNINNKQAFIIGTTTPAEENIPLTSETLPTFLTLKRSNQAPPVPQPVSVRFLDPTVT